MIMMMMKSFLNLLLLTLSPSLGLSFNPQHHEPSRHHPSTLVDDFSEKWSELERRRKEFEYNPPTNAESYQLVKEMLEVALGALRAEEQKAFDHAVQARERQEKAVEEEHLLERQVKKAHDEVQEAHDEIASFHHKYLTNLDEWEMHRQVVNLDIAHRVEEYVARRLAETKAAESAAVHEEDEADEELLTLMTQQEELQAMLEELQQQQQQPVAKKNKAISDGKSSEAK